MDSTNFHKIHPVTLSSPRALTHFVFISTFVLPSVFLNRPTILFTSHNPQLSSVRPTIKGSEYFYNLLHASSSFDDSLYFLRHFTTSSPSLSHPQHSPCESHWLLIFIPRILIFMFLILHLFFLLYHYCCFISISCFFFTFSRVNSISSSLV